MSEEKLKILEMLKEGKITTDEALALLKQVPDAGERRHEHHWQDNEDRPMRPLHPTYPPYRPDFSWLNDLRTAIVETTENAVFPTDLIFGANQEIFTASAEVGNGIRSLVFEGKNAPVRLESHGGDSIEVEARYKAKSQRNPHFTFTGDNGVFSLRYDDNSLYSLGISIRVPENVRIGSVQLKNKNAPVSIGDILAEKIVLSTKNDSIKVSDVKGERLYCDTKNSPITLDDIEIREIDAQTTNAKISLDDVAAFRARLVTNNAKIDVKDVDITELYVKTTNSSLRLQNLGYRAQEPICNIEAITTNGQISVHLPKLALDCALHASTTNGGVYSELNDLEYRVNEKNYVEARTRGYEAAEYKLNLNLQTTNGGIYVKQ